MIERTQEEIDDVLNGCIDAENEGSKFPGMSYEEGIKYAIEWILGESDVHPLEE